MQACSQQGELRCCFHSASSLPLALPLLPVQAWLLALELWQAARVRAQQQQQNLQELFWQAVAAWRELERVKV